jgi:WD40 repeat protein
VLASGSSDGTVRFWDPVTGKQLAVVDGRGGNVVCLAFSPSGKSLAFVTGTFHASVHLYDLETGKRLRSPERPQQNFARIAFAPDGRSLALAGHDHVVYVLASRVGP